MKQAVIKELSTNDLVERLEEERKKLTRLRLSHTVSPLDNPMKIRQNRKTIARILTELKKRELEKNKKTS
ncbi:MAG TPA: 50S ribosomal protein L29 [Bacteroidales bacterium]|jgi:large subunit ribosomal protein L29|nr:50S ribosomal protein L29 [Bacteroidales bacterium]MDI9574349.1 50S ribosomal protein L29 [Bacteroidota bacterium]OQC61668.1 MAG: 50S ribosomal protein L29 [Bacteroidetes bacterium ADurb.Bin012]MBP9512202.1 50S ribosomal protein L29 [Bacteroidales bacterium]MBP9587539.1 50S ribosomal protein L29 [Bacteroidales bacterium]